MLQIYFMFLINDDRLHFITLRHTIRLNFYDNQTRWGDLEKKHFMTLKRRLN